MTSMAPTDRFLRPADVSAVRRNRRQLQARRILVVAANLVFLLALVAAATWLVQRAKSDERFAIRKVAVEGAHFTSLASIKTVTDSLEGANLFRLDIDGLRGKLLSLPWVESVSIEKQLPDVLRVSIRERVPVAVTTISGSSRYVDRTGKVFADVSPEVGNPDLPIVNPSTGAELRRTIAFLAVLRSEDPALYSRVSEIAPISPSSFSVFDRDLAAEVLLDSESAVRRWRDLYAIARAERYVKGEIQYADLRFDDRVVVKSNRRTERAAIQSSPLPEVVTN